MDFEEVGDVLTTLANVGKRIETMSDSLASSCSGVTLPAGSDLSGLNNALRILASAYTQTYRQYNSLVSVVKSAQQADRSWGDHVKGWLTPRRTGVGWLDHQLSRPGSRAAGAVDAGHDLGAGVLGLANDFNPYANWQAHRRGDDVLPIQRPGLGFINLGAHPLDSAKGFVGWQYRNDPERMQAYAAVNIFTTIATGGAGEAAEAGMAARLGRIGGTRAAMLEDITKLEQRLESLPASRQRRPAKLKAVRRDRRQMLQNIEDAQARLAQYEQRIAAQEARLQAALTDLRALRNTRIARAIAAAQSLLVTHMVTSPAARHVWETFTEGSSLGNAGLDYRETQEYRDRLREIAAARMQRP